MFSVPDHVSHVESGLQELSEWIEVGPRQSRSHIWTSETMCVYLQFLAGEIRHRRRQLGLDHGARALILCDQATQHSSRKFKTIREQWSKQHNVESWSGSFGILQDISNYIYIYMYV